MEYDRDNSGVKPLALPAEGSQKTSNLATSTTAASGTVAEILPQEVRGAFPQLFPARGEMRARTDRTHAPNSWAGNPALPRK